MNYERLYSFRFRDVDQGSRQEVWNQIAPHVHGLMGAPQKVLDPAAGRGEFIGAVPAGRPGRSTRSATSRPPTSPTPP